LGSPLGWDIGLPLAIARLRLPGGSGWGVKQQGAPAGSPAVRSELADRSQLIRPAGPGLGRHGASPAGAPPYGSVGRRAPAADAGGQPAGPAARVGPFDCRRHRRSPAHAACPGGARAARRPSRGALRRLTGLAASGDALTPCTCAPRRLGARPRLGDHREPGPPLGLSLCAAHRTRGRPTALPSRAIGGCE